MRFPVVMPALCQQSNTTGRQTGVAARVSTTLHHAFQERSPLAHVGTIAPHRTLFPSRFFAHSLKNQFTNNGPLF